MYVYICLTRFQNDKHMLSKKFLMSVEFCSSQGSVQCLDFYPHFTAASLDKHLRDATKESKQAAHVSHVVPNYVFLCCHVQLEPLCSHCTDIP